MKRFLILIFLLVPSLAFASQKVFYDQISNLRIVDISGQKTKKDIVKEFNLVNIDSVQELTIDETQEGVKVIGNGTLVKYNYVAEAQKEAEKKKETKEYKEFLIKQKLGLLDSDWLNLKEALGLSQ